VASVAAGVCSGIDFRKDLLTSALGRFCLCTRVLRPRTQTVVDVLGLHVAFTDYLGNEGVNYRARMASLCRFRHPHRRCDRRHHDTLLVGERPPVRRHPRLVVCGNGPELDGSAEVVLASRNGILRRGTACPRAIFLRSGQGGNLCDTFHFWSFIAAAPTSSLRRLRPLPALLRRADHAGARHRAGGETVTVRTESV